MSEPNEKKAAIRLIGIAAAVIIGDVLRSFIGHVWSIVFVCLTITCLQVVLAMWFSKK